MKYENRVVLFLDILGFKELVDRTTDKDNNDNEIAIEKLYQILNYVNEYKQENLEKDRIVTQFSDTLVISFSEKLSSRLQLLFYQISILVTRLINEGILCRGAISYGKLIHTNDIIFGPALIDAYLTELKAAMYPRIILDKSILDIARKSMNYHIEKGDRDSILEIHLNQDFDDKYFIDYFEKSTEIFNFPELYNYIQNLRTIIVSGRRFQKPDLKVKFGWMKNKFNAMIDKFNQPDFKFAGEFTKPSLEELDRIKKIKKIQ